MLKSMTGFGRSETNIGNRKYVIEIKSLNSKQLDLGLRLPSLVRDLEFPIREKIAAYLKRGKVDFALSYENLDSSCEMATINEELLKAYYTKMAGIYSSLNLQMPDSSLVQFLKLPEVVRTEKKEITDQERQAVIESVEEALASLCKHRVSEGAVLEKDLVARVDLIENLLREVEPYEEGRIATIRSRMTQHLKEFEGKVDQNRFEQEIIYYLEKLDITEEKVRLRNHCKYFRDTAATEPESGRKLAFIAQEMGREINTLGSKSNNAQMQILVVKMKDELEKIKEQVLNIL